MIQTRRENFDETKERTSEGCTICVTTPPKAKTKARIKTKVKTNARARKGISIVRIEINDYMESWPTKAFRVADSKHHFPKG